MNRPLCIAIINRDGLPSAPFATIVAAVNRQLGDVNAAWRTQASCHVASSPEGHDAYLQVQAVCDVPNAGGYHTANGDGRPWGLVSVDVAKEAGVPWSVYLSHEAIELAVDPDAAVMVVGPCPDPDMGGRRVYLPREACDPVQGSFYVQDDVTLSDFVLPEWFRRRRGGVAHGPVDHLNLIHSPFAVAPGGYVAWTDPTTGQSQYYFADRTARDEVLTRRARMGASRVRRESP